MGLNKSAKAQIEAGQTEKTKFEGLINRFDYGASKFKKGLDNPFADATNPFADIKNPFDNARVATRATEIQQEQAGQNRANILDAVVQGGGAAGASATALAQEAAQSNRQISAGLEQQELQLGQQRNQAELQRQQLIAQGEQRRQQLVGQGAQYVLGLQEQRAQAELQGLGARFAGAQQTINSGYESIAANNAAVIGAIGTIGAGALGGAGAAGGFGKLFSDHRLKENIKFDRFSPKGVGIYHFNYKGKPEHKFEGVLSAAVPEEAKIKNFKGTEFDGVDYNKLDVDFKKIN